MILHISHNDLDGVGCGILVKKCMKRVDVEYLSYGTVDQFILENYHNYDKIIISDLYPDPETVAKLASEKDVVLIDHHPSSLPLTEYDFVIHDTTKSATLLTYEWLKSQDYDVSEYSDLVDIINDYDMWHMAREDECLGMNMLFMMIGIQKFESRFLKNPSSSFNEAEELLVSCEKVRRNTYIENAFASGFSIIDKRGLSVFVTFAELYSSELGGYVLQSGDYDYAVLINMRTKKVSLRSRRDVDVRMIAEMNGGGGHKNASGFPTNFDFGIFDFLIDADIYNGS